jgi:hypothetical protein
MYILGTSNVVKSNGVSWWAQDGMVCRQVEDSSKLADGEDAYTAYEVADVLRRLQELIPWTKARIRGGARRGNKSLPIEVDQTFIENMVELCRMARAQKAAIAATSRPVRVSMNGVTNPTIRRDLVLPSLAESPAARDDQAAG